MADESDGLTENVDQRTRVALQVAMQAAEQVARARQNAAHRAQAADQQEATQLRARMDAERATAGIEFSQTRDARWWEQASPQQIGDTYQSAVAWRDEHPQARDTERHMRETLHQRYGIDVDDLQADPAAVAAELERRQQQAATEREGAGAQRGEAESLMAQSELAEGRSRAADQEAETGTDPAAREDARTEARAFEDVAERLEAEGVGQWDSVQRREQQAEALRGEGVPENAVQARTLADVSQAKPATEAVAGRNGDAQGVARARPGHGQTLQRQNPGLSR